MDSQSAQAVAGSNGDPQWANRVLEDPAVLALRSDGERPPIELDDPENSDDGPSRPEQEDVFHNHTVIDAASTSDRLVTTGDGDAGSVSEFLSQTDFDSEALYLETTTIRECFRLRLCQVSWSTERVKTDYTRVLRPYDERCHANRRNFESRLIRIPAPLESDAVSGYGSSVSSSGTCSGNTNGGHKEQSGGGSQSQPDRSPLEGVQ